MKMQACEIRVEFKRLNSNSGEADYVETAFVPKSRQ